LLIETLHGGEALSRLQNITGLSDEGARIDLSELVGKDILHKKVRVVIHTMY